MSEGHNFERWFEFALSKKAEIIHLSGYHDIDYEGLFHRFPNTNNGFECLQDLYLSDSRMTDQDFQFLLSNCIALESLKFAFPLKLENASIVGHSKLKHLDFSYSRLDSNVIRDAISLVSLALYSLSDGCSVQLSNILKLTTGMPSCMRNQLQIIPSPYFLCNFFHLVRLVEACTLLDKLMIEFPYMLASDNEDMLETYVGRRCELSPKYLEISSYSGATSQLVFTLYLIDNARSLKKATGGS
ncbi:hypothetical protein AAHA92_24944 [Salvia divinorum]|uniref:F-box/LRR-repeat protein 15/At3g58940/PEG3-like LRR domain-containing protein n=1 Tax=Salvia divinorum TaxID=28513 RepID=A0ABD1G906_SALDI